MDYVPIYKRYADAVISLERQLPKDQIFMCVSLSGSIAGHFIGYRRELLTGAEMEMYTVQMGGNHCDARSFGTLFNLARQRGVNIYSIDMEANFRVRQNITGFVNGHSSTHNVRVKHKHCTLFAEKRKDSTFVNSKSRISAHFKGCEKPLEESEKLNWFPSGSGVDDFIGYGTIVSEPNLWRYKLDKENVSRFPHVAEIKKMLESIPLHVEPIRN